MAKKERKTPELGELRKREADEAPKGQYGSLKGLGPGGGSDIKDAASDIDRDDIEATKN